MTVEFDKSFDKSIAKLGNQSVARDIEEVIENVEQASSYAGIKSFKKLKGYRDAETEARSAAKTQKNTEPISCHEVTRWLFSFRMPEPAEYLTSSPTEFLRLREYSVPKPTVAFS